MGEVMKVIVIGAGPSGIIAALKASENHEVVLLDSNNQIGKKLLLTGNGKCNYWNFSINKNKYITESPDELNNILTEENINNTFKYLTSLGITPRISQDLCYPYSNTSLSVNNILNNSLNNHHVTFIGNFKVINIDKNNSKFQIYGENEGVIEGDKVIIACGGVSYPKTGSDGSLLNVINKNHEIISLTPALTRINLEGNFKEIENIRAHGKVRVISEGNIIYEDEGEIHFTKSGISGIVTFNASLHCSRLIRDNKRVSISLDLMSDIDNLYDWFNNKERVLINKTIENVLDSIFHYKLLFYILSTSHINKNKLWSELTEEEKKLLISTIKNLTFKVASLDDFSSSQVTLGGVTLKCIETDTFESKNIRDLYFIGECLDVTGLCGGYNLSFAFISGYIVGTKI